VPKASLDTRRMRWIDQNWAPKCSCGQRWSKATWNFSRWVFPKTSSVFLVLGLGVCVCVRVGFRVSDASGGGLGLNGRRQQKWRPHEGTTSTKSTWIRGFSCDGTMLLELVWMGRFLSMYLLSIHYTLVSWTLNVLLIQYARGSTLQIIQTQSWRQILWPD
jgi:hypothetical protein